MIIDSNPFKFPKDEKCEVVENSQKKNSWIQMLISTIKNCFIPSRIGKEIHFIGAVGIPNQSWRGEGGKELYTERYGFERIAILKRDREGRPIAEDGTLVSNGGKSAEMHFYAKTLTSTYQEWKQKLKQRELSEKEKRFDIYVDSKMQIDPLFRAEIEKENVRFFHENELNQTKAVVTKENGIQQIGLDNEDQTLKPLKRGTYAFVMGRQGDKTPHPDDYALFLAVKENTDKGKIQHSSFLRGGKVVSAGIIEVNDQGKIEAIVQYSGHYLPTHQEMSIVIDYLKQHLEEEEFNKITLSINKYSGWGLKLTMATNTVVQKFFKYKLDLGMVDFPANQWNNFLTL